MMALEVQTRNVFNFGINSSNVFGIDNSRQARDQVTEKVLVEIPDGLKEEITRQSRRTPEDLEFREFEFSGCKDVISLSVHHISFSCIVDRQGTVNKSKIENSLHERVRCEQEQARFIKVKCGDVGTIALSKSNEVYAFGRNWEFRHYNMLGLKNSNGHLKKAESLQRLCMSGNDEKPLENITDIACGSRHFMALDTEGRVIEWGRNLATLEEKTQEYIQPTRLQAFDQNRITRIFAGSDCSAAVDSNNNFWVWGNNGHGQLGLGSVRKTTCHFQRVRMQRCPCPQYDSFEIQLIQNVGAIDKDRNIIHDDDNLHEISDIDSALATYPRSIMKNELFRISPTDCVRFDFMYIDKSFLKDMKKTHITAPQKVPFEFTNLIVHVSFGQEHSGVLLQNGEIWTCGSNDVGQLGHSESTEYQRIASDKTFVELQCAHRYTVAVTDNGEIYFWGTMYRDEDSEKEFIQNLDSTPKVLSVKYPQNQKDFSLTL